MERQQELPPSAFPLRQDGAVGIFFVLALSSALLCAVLALDAGRLYWEGQELQRLADMAALDAATSSNHLLNGSPIEAEGEDELLTLAESSVRRNLPDSYWNVTTSVEQLGILPSSAGSVRTSCRIGECPSDIKAYDAVEVTVRRNVCASILVNLAYLFSGTNETPAASEDCLTPATASIFRSATASKPTVVAFSVGSSLLSLCTRESAILEAFLDAMLETGICSTIVGPGGVLDANISLLELLNGINSHAELSIGSIDELLGTELSIGQLIDASLAVLPSEHLNALSEFKRRLRYGVSDFDFQMAQLLDLTGLPDDSAASTAALATRISMGDLLSTAVMLAHKCQNEDCHSSAISVPVSTINLGLAKLEELTIKIIQPPVIAIGPVGCKGATRTPLSQTGCDEWITEATTAQVRIDTVLAVNLGELINVDLSVNLKGVGASAGFSSISRLDNSDSSAKYELSGGGHVNPLEGGANVRISLLQNQVSLLEGLLQGLLGLLNLDALISVEPFPPLELSIMNDRSFSKDSAEKTVRWPEHDSIPVHSMNLLENLGDTLVKNVSISTKVRSCIINLLGLRICRGPERNEDIVINLDKLLPGATSLLQVLASALDQHLLPLFDALGIAVGPTEIRILDVHAHSSAILI